MLPATNADIGRAPRDRRMCMAVLPFERSRRRLFDPGRITNGISSVHDVIVAIDVKRLAGDEARGVVRQESGGDAHIVDAHQTARRRFRLGLVEQGVEFGKSTRMEGDHSLPVSPYVQRSREAYVPTRRDRTPGYRFSQGQSGAIWQGPRGEAPRDRLRR